MSTIIQTAQRAITGFSRILPGDLGPLTMRASNLVLRNIAPRYEARTYFGARMQCDPKDLVQRTILNFGIWEPNLSHLIQKVLRVGDVFVDVGANVGYDSLLGAAAVGSSGRVIAIEASARTFDLLQGNLKLNDGDMSAGGNVRAVNVAVSDHEGVLSLYERHPHNIGAATTVPTGSGVVLQRIECKPLHAILLPDELKRVRLIKIDVEGAEPSILRNLLDNLALYPRELEVIVEASPQEAPDEWLQLFERLRSAGFGTWAIPSFYDTRSYLRWRGPQALRVLDHPPSAQEDLLLSRDPHPDRRV